MRRATIGERWQNQLKFAMWCCKKSVKVADMYLRPRLEMLCINLKIAQCISCHPYHLLGPLHDSCLLSPPPLRRVLGFIRRPIDGPAANGTGGQGGCRPPAADIRPHARLYSHKMTPFRSTLALLESYDIASCVWLYGGQGSFQC